MEWDLAKSLILMIAAQIVGALFVLIKWGPQVIRHVVTDFPEFEKTVDRRLERISAKVNDVARQVQDVREKIAEHRTQLPAQDRRLDLLEDAVFRKGKPG